MTNPIDEREQLLANLPKHGPESTPASVPSGSDCLSPTLCCLDPRRRPHPMPVCGGCPSSMWLSTDSSLRCFCRVMHAVTYSSDEPDQTIRSCDGALRSCE